jgi:hypothetical protein
MDKDDTWLKAHLEEIVDRYAHKEIAILDQEIVKGGSCFDGLSANGKSATIAVTAPFALSLSKGERQIDQKN